MVGPCAVSRTRDTGPECSPRARAPSAANSRRTLEGLPVAAAEGGRHQTDTGARRRVCRRFGRGPPFQAARTPGRRAVGQGPLIASVLAVCVAAAIATPLAQPARPGRAAFERSCARCHGQGGEMGPASWRGWRCAPTRSCRRWSATGCRPRGCRAARCPTPSCGRWSRSPAACARSAPTAPAPTRVTMADGGTLTASRSTARRPTCSSSPTAATCTCCAAPAKRGAGSRRRPTGRPTTAIAAAIATARSTRSTAPRSAASRRRGCSRCPTPRACRSRRSSSAA